MWAGLTPTGSKFGSLNGATHVTAVPAPGDGRSRTVFSLGGANTTGATITVNLFINDSAGTRYQFDVFSPAAGISWTVVDRYPGGVFLKGSEYLELSTGGGVTEDWYAAWADTPQLGGGSRI